MRGKATEGEEEEEGRGEEGVENQLLAYHRASGSNASLCPSIPRRPFTESCQVVGRRQRGRAAQVADGLGKEGRESAAAPCLPSDHQHRTPSLAPPSSAPSTRIARPCRSSRQPSAAYPVARSPAPCPSRRRAPSPSAAAISSSRAGPSTRARRRRRPGRSTRTPSSPSTARRPRRTSRSASTRCVLRGAGAASCWRSSSNAWRSALRELPSEQTTFPPSCPPLLTTARCRPRLSSSSPSPPPPQLSKKYHPDLRPDDADAKAKYLEISAAYDTLGNASKRCVACPPFALGRPVGSPRRRQLFN